MKKIPLEQWILIIVAIIYLLESIILAGLFTNILLFGITFVIGVITTIVSIIKKQYKWAIIDVIICLFCSGLVYYLYSL